MPDICGSTRPSIICAATIASMALPPRSSMSRAARVANGWAVMAMRGVGEGARGAWDSWRTSAQALRSRRRRAAIDRWFMDRQRVMDRADIIASAASVSVIISFRRRDARVAEGGALLRRYMGLTPYRGFESLSLRHIVE